MKSSLLLAAVVIALVGVLMPGASKNVAYAKDTPIWFTPDAGPADEEVMVAGGMWPENGSSRHSRRSRKGALRLLTSSLDPSKL